MFGAHGVYHMVPIALAIGVFLPLPFILAVSALHDTMHVAVYGADGARFPYLVVHLAQGGLRELQHTDYPPVLGIHVGRHQHLGQPSYGHWSLLSVVGPHALPALVHEVQVRPADCQGATSEAY